MANIYYKNQNQKYSLLTYADIDAAAASHQHLISDFVLPNFQNNGCVGQNILNLYDENCDDLLFYVPHTHSDLIYGKKILNNDIDSHARVPYLNRNKTITKTIDTSIHDMYDGYYTSINLSYNTAYQFNGIGVLSPTVSKNNLQNCYFFPMKIMPSTFPEESDDHSVMLVFKTNIYDYLSVIAFTFNNNNIEVDTTMTSLETGLVLDNNNIIGIYIDTSDVILRQQIEITDIAITMWDTTLTITQDYIDYFDVSNIPPIEISGSLGPITNNISYYDLNDEQSVIKYYRSFRFDNLLTWGQSITMTKYVMSGYANYTGNARNKGWFYIDLPCEIDPNITVNDINLSATSGQNEIWAAGAVTNRSTLIKYNNTTVTSTQIAYNVVGIQPANGRIMFDIYFYPIDSSFIGAYAPLCFLANDKLTISINDYS